MAAVDGSTLKLSDNRAVSDNLAAGVWRVDRPACPAHVRAMLAKPVRDRAKPKVSQRSSRDQK